MSSKNNSNNNSNNHAANNIAADNKSIYTVEINKQTEDEKITLITKTVSSENASAMLRSSISNNNKLPSSFGAPGSALSNNRKPSPKHNSSNSSTKTTSNDNHNSSAYTISSTDELSFEESILDESPLSLLEKNSQQRQQLLRGNTYRGKGLPLEVQRKRLLAATSGQGGTYGASSSGNKSSVSVGPKGSSSNKSTRSAGGSSTKGSGGSISGKSYKSHIKQKQRQANVPTTIEELSIDSYSVSQAEDDEEKWTKDDDKWLEESSDGMLSDDGDFSVSVDEEISILSQMEQRRTTTSHNMSSKSKNMNSESEKKKSWLGSWGSSVQKKEKDTYSMESSSISSSREGGWTTISSSRESMSSAASRSNTSQSTANQSTASSRRSGTSSSRSYHSGPSTVSPQSEDASHHHLHSIQEDDENELPPPSSVSSQYQTNISNLVSSSMRSTSSGGQNDINESTSKTKRGKSIFSKLLGGKSSHTVASRLGYHPPSPIEKQRVDNLLNNEFPQENNLHNISTPGGHSSSSTTSSCVKRARELLVDIESHEPSYDNNSSYNNNSRRKRRLCNNNNKIFSKKGCIISSTLLLLIFGIVGTLTSLNVIMLPSSLDWRAFSLGNNNNNSSTVEETSEGEGGEVVSTEVWYVNWDIYKCVKDCIGPLPCGGERTTHLEVDFASLESCCKHGFEVYISNDWSVEECIEVSSYGIEPNNDEDGDEDTEYPTFSPVMQGEIKTSRPNKQPTVVQGSRTPPSSPNDGQFNVPATEEKEMYYANWDTNKCTLQSSLTKKPWDIGYETEEECCVPNFGWISDSDCYTDGSSGIVAPSPSVVDNTQEDESDSLVYYPDFVQGKCLPKSSTATHSRFQHTFATYDKCCHDNFRWNVDSDCYTDTNVDVTTVIDKRDDTLPPGAPPPEDTEEGDEEEEDTSVSTVDLSDIIGTASPSVTPTSINQKYYADFTTRTCILKHVSTMARWDTGYESHDTCCMKNFSYDPNSVCYVGKQDADAVTTTTSATTSIASEETDEEESAVEMFYFAHFDQGKCIEDTAEQGAKWGLGYSTQDECCHAYFKYSRESSCYDGSAGTLSLNQTDNGDRIIDNGEVTLAPSNSPTYLPTTDFPTLVSKSPSTKPTLRPSNSPIVLGTPTESPDASPSSSPTDSSMPTSHPTQKPTHKPSISPTVGSTNAPTSSPLNQLEVLSVELIVISPESTEDLNDSSSSQYRAMKWLTGNADYSTYDSSRKVQRWALATFYRSLSGPDWVDNSGWMEDDDTGDDECTWYGITCDANGIVTSINLEQNDVGGEIPYEIALLDNLESLVLNTNFISGISSSVFSLINLQILDLDKNFIEELPSDITLPLSGGNLQHLYLSNNKLTTISDELFKLKQVTNLWLSNNRIASTIPAGIGMMTNLQELDLESNLFEGSIPTELYSLSKLHTLILHDNLLSGSISPLISQVTSLTTLDLDSNAISGELPAQIGFLSQLSQLHLGNNAMIGQIPWPQLSMLAGSLEELDMSENYLSSTIGFEVGSLSNLVKLKLDNNYRLDENDNLISNGIQGPIPGSIGGLSKLEELRLDNNYVGGAIPASIGDLLSLVVLRLESNNLQSSIPSTIGNLASLQYFHLWSNYISSTIPGQLGRLTNLRELFLDDNELTGYIPPELGQLTSANYISLAENNLSGVIPPTFGMLSSIGRIDLQFNNLVGEVPSQLGNLPLGMLKLEGNNFYGDIPEGICQNIQYLSGNCSTGRRRLSESVGRDWGIVDSVTTQNVPTPSPTFHYWWSCNCCTTCYPGEQ